MMMTSQIHLLHDISVAFYLTDNYSKQPILQVIIKEAGKVLPIAAHNHGYYGLKNQQNGEHTYEFYARGYLVETRTVLLEGQSDILHISMVYEVDNPKLMTLNRRVLQFETMQKDFSIVITQPPPYLKVVEKYQQDSFLHIACEYNPMLLGEQFLCVKSQESTSLPVLLAQKPIELISYDFEKNVYVIDQQEANIKRGDILLPYLHCSTNEQGCVVYALKQHFASGPSLQLFAFYEYGCAVLPMISYTEDKNKTIHIAWTVNQKRRGT